MPQTPPHEPSSSPSDPPSDPKPRGLAVRRSRLTDAPREGKTNKPARAGNRWRRPTTYIVPVVAALVLGSVAGIALAAAIQMPRVDSVSSFTPTLITEFRDRDGEVFTSYARERRILLEESEIPPLLQNAVVATEDSNFFQHGGVDATGVMRAALANWRSGERGEGASTLTMQLARQLFLSREKQWRRKIEEAFLAVELEKELTKQQILTMYCNLINMGHGRYGMEAASRYYFGKSVGDLTLVEAATLAGIPQRPSDYSPYRRPDLVIKRRDYVLRRMRAEGYITDAQYQEATQAPLEVVEHRSSETLAPYFAEEVRKHLEAQYGATRVVEGGLDVYTTLDRRAQRATEEALEDGLVRLDHRRGWRGPIRQLEESEDPATVELESWTGEPATPGRWFQGVVRTVDGREARVRHGEQTYTLTAEGLGWTRRSRPDDLLSVGDVAWFRLEAGEEAEDGAAGEPVLHLEQAPAVEGAALVIESATGAVRAMVGGWSYQRSKFNRATQAERQVGSAFKLFVYGAALEGCYTAADTVFDAPTAFRGATGARGYQPRNHSRRFQGIMTLRRALELSINVPAVKLLDMVGVDRVIDFARRAGVESDLPPYPSLALGAAELRPIELAAAYAAIANQGTWVKPYFIERVVGPDSLALEVHQPETRPTTDPRIAYILTHMLEGVVDRGTATKLRSLDVDIAGKTGTTDDYSDAWFVGFTPRYTVLVWVGYDVKRSLGRGMDGSSAAAPIWKEIVATGLDPDDPNGGWIEPGGRFQPPAGIVFAGVDPRSGLLSSGGVREAFIAGTEPRQSHGPQSNLITSLPWYQQQAFYLPKEGERMPGGGGSEEPDAEVDGGE